MKIAIAQINPTVGDIEGNCTRIINTATELARRVDLVVFPELSLVGYPPRDLLDRDWFVSRAADATTAIAKATRSMESCGVLFGAPVRDADCRGCLRNAAILAAGGQIVSVHAKSLLPSYDVFDEARYFDPAESVSTASFSGKVLGISVGEDAWTIPDLAQGRNIGSLDAIGESVANGAQLIVNISASPFEVGVDRTRYELMRAHVLKHRVPMVFVNQVGGNDDVLFDGRSMAFSADGHLLSIGGAFEEWIEIVDASANERRACFEPLDEVKSIHDALVMGIRDYVRKCGFSKVVVGVSGGIDSAVVCCLAAQALGPANVLGITSPSQYSSKGSVEDSQLLASRLGIHLEVIPIHSLYSAYLDVLSKHLDGIEDSVAAENIQARIRGNIWMAFSNQRGYLVLTAGNKSELAVGYCTLYGDMSGALAVLADVPKTIVYKLAEYINRERELIPRAILEKPPSAELRPGQLDQDTLPPYSILDEILRCYIEEGFSPEEIVARGFDGGTVSWVVRAVDRSEYKRRQAPPGLRVTSKAFGTGRRMPIAARHS